MCSTSDPLLEPPHPTPPPADDFDPKPKPTQKKKETTVTPATSGKPTKDDFYSQLAAETEDLSEVSDANQSIDVDAHKDVNDKDTKVFGNKKSTPKGYSQ